jgi:hypothetical protein
MRYDSTQGSNCEFHKKKSNCDGALHPVLVSERLYDDHVLLYTRGVVPPREG